MKRGIRQAFFLMAVICFLILPAQAVFAYGAGTTVFRTVQRASEGCRLAAVEGRYVTDVHAALNRINAIRLEACRDHIRDPRNSARTLTMQDYVPIRWSQSLEYIARVRAAEASILIAHVRPNGKDCFTVQAPDGTYSGGEVLAWNDSSGMIQGIDQWYEEKEIWVRQGQGVTGHYTEMIDPSNTCVGLACFLNPNGIFDNTTAGEFSSNVEPSSDGMAPIPDCRVIIDVSNAALGAPKLVRVAEAVQKWGYLDRGDHVTYALGMDAVLDGRTVTVLDGGQTYWSSSNPENVQVDGFGTISLSGRGSAVISASSDTGASASRVIEPVHEQGPWKTERKASASQSGIQVRRCRRCGEIAETREIPQVGSISTMPGTLTYKGKTLRPSVTVRDVNGKKIAASNYKVSYSHNKNVGFATVTVAFRSGSSYAGKGTASFTIRPQKVSGFRVYSGKKSLKVSWKKQARQISGFEIQYSTDKKFINARTLLIRKKGVRSAVIRKLAARKKYYVRVRAYRDVKGGRIVSGWSKKRAVKTRR